MILTWNLNRNLDLNLEREKRYAIYVDGGTLRLPEAKSGKDDGVVKATAVDTTQFIDSDNDEDEEPYDELDEYFGETE